MATSKCFSISSAMWTYLCLAALALTLTSGAPSISPLEAENSTAATVVTAVTHNNTAVTPAANTTTAAAPTIITNATVITTTPQTNVTTPDTNVTTTSSHNHTTIETTSLPSNMTTSASNTTATSVGPTHSTTHAPRSGRKFDVASFFGGMAAAVGLTILIFVAVRCYTNSRKTSYSAM